MKNERGGGCIQDLEKTKDAGATLWADQEPVFSVTTKTRRDNARGRAQVFLPKVDFQSIVGRCLVAGDNDFN